MPVTTIIRSVTYSGNGSTSTPYTVTFPYDAAADVKLLIDGVASTAFTLSGDELRTDEAVDAGSSLVIYRDTPLTQEQTFPSNTTPAAENVRAAVDKLTLIAQERNEEIGRSIKPPIGSSFANNTTLGVDASGNPVARTAEEESTHLGIGASVTAAAASAAAAQASAITAEEQSSLANLEAVAAAASAVSAEYATVTALGGELVVDAIADGQSHPLSDTYATLEAAQADFPAAEALTDEQDWAAIQSKLDTFNLVSGEETGGTVYLPEGHYIINKTLTIRGPGVTLKGAGKIRTYLEYTPLTGTAVRLGFAEDSDFDTRGQSGAPRSVSLQDFKFVHGSPTNASNTTTGFTTRTPLGGADLWLVLYLILDRVDFEGFDIAAEFSNVPICVLRDCSITGKTRSLRLYKIDSMLCINCDLNGTYIPRNNIDNTQIDYDDNINIECIAADAGDMTSDGLFPGGGPFGGGFFLEIIGGELGHGKAVMINGGLPVKIQGSNVEDITNDWAFFLDGPSRLSLENVRLELQSTVTGDFSSMDSVFKVDCTTGTASHPQLRLKDVVIPGWPTDKPHFIVTGDTTKAGTVKIWQDEAKRISWRDETGTERALTEKSGLIMDWRRPRTSVSDTNAGNPDLHQGMFWLGASTNFPEDLVAPYRTAADPDTEHAWFRSSLLNHRMQKTFYSILASASSSAGDAGLFTDPILSQAVVPPFSVHDEGDMIKLELSGTFAANGNTKGIKFLIGWDDAVTPSNGQNDFFGAQTGTWNGKAWHCEVTAVRRSTVTYRISTRLFIDGENPLIKNESLNVQLAQETRWRILPTGTDAADVVLDSFVAKYVQGTSNL